MWQRSVEPGLERVVYSVSSLKGQYTVQVQVMLDENEIIVFLYSKLSICVQ